MSHVLAVDHALSLSSHHPLQLRRPIVSLSLRIIHLRHRPSLPTSSTFPSPCRAKTSSMEGIETTSGSMFDLGDLAAALVPTRALPEAAWPVASRRPDMTTRREHPRQPRRSRQDRSISPARDTGSTCDAPYGREWRTERLESAHDEQAERRSRPRERTAITGGMPSALETFLHNSRLPRLGDAESLSGMSTSTHGRRKPIPEMYHSAARTRQSRLGLGQEHPRPVLCHRWDRSLLSSGRCRLQHRHPPGSTNKMGGRFPPGLMMSTQKRIARHSSPSLKTLDG